jgi:hypothetical protein
MKLYGAIAVHVDAVDVVRAPKFFEKVQRVFGRSPDLRTGKQHSAIEAAALIDATRDAFRRVGATNAISLVVDNTVLFHDRDAKPDDLGDLFLAFHDNASVFGEQFEELRLAIEHHEAGLHVVLEAQARPVHARGVPPIRVVISGRVEALTPKPGEDADAYRSRVEPIATDRNALETYRVQFEAFVQRVRDAIATAMPTARVEVESAEARIVRPHPTQPEQPLPPDARDYDPYVAYYPNRFGMLGEMFMWSALFSMMMPPHFAVVDHHNHVQGHADDPGIQDTDTSTATEADTSWYESDSSSAGDVAEGVGADADVGGGGGWWSDLGGDFGDVDF